MSTYKIGYALIPPLSPPLVFLKIKGNHNKTLRCATPSRNKTNGNFKYLCLRAYEKLIVFCLICATVGWVQDGGGRGWFLFFSRVTWVCGSGGMKAMEPMYDFPSTEAGGNPIRATLASRRADRANKEMALMESPMCIFVFSGPAQAAGCALGLKSPLRQFTGAHFNVKFNRLRFILLNENRKWLRSWRKY